MMVKVFSVYDQKAKLHMHPFYMATTGQAVRAFEDTVNDPKTVINKHPADFTLFEIGLFDEETAMFDVYDAKINLGNALEYVAQNEIDFSQLDVDEYVA